MDKLFRDVPAGWRYGSLGAAGVLAALLAVFVLVSGGGGDEGSRSSPTPTEVARAQEEQPLVSELTTSTETPTPTPTPSPTPTPEPATPTPPPEPTPEPAPPFTPTEAIVAMTATTYAGPSSATQPIGYLYQGQPVTLVGAAYGENWIIGAQDWVPVEQPWERTWYLLDDGSYVYKAFVYIPDGASPFAGSADHYVIVDVNAQLAWAMDGENIVREIPITSGKAGFETPIGEFNVIGRVQNERMTSERAGITGVAEQYDVQRVLYTQYFALGGFALHLNYWQPLGVYGSYPTSHGCVGIPLADAQFLWLFGDAGMRVIVRDGGGATPAPAPPAPTATPTPVPTEEPTPDATPVATPEPTPSATPTPSPTSTVTPEPSEAASPTTTATPSPEVARLEGAPEQA